MPKDTKVVSYTEMFGPSVQGEALNTGRLCTWLRLFACSLQCRGFGQEEPGNPDTWVEQRPGINIRDITDLSTIPTPSVGCDSDYSWNAKFKHLVTKASTHQVAFDIKAMLPNGRFGKIGHVFTGGEPLMQQKQIAEIIEHWLDNLRYDAGDLPAWVAFETNGTQEIGGELYRAIRSLEDNGVEVYFSISPKLLHVAGERPEKAIKLDVINDYLDICPRSYLKFVLNEDQRAWDQAEDIVKQVEKQHNVDVWVMPVGGVVEQQLDPAVGRIADKAIQQYQWNVSPRVHVLLWGNEQMGR